VRFRLRFPSGPQAGPSGVTDYRTHQEDPISYLRMSIYSGLRCLMWIGAALCGSADAWAQLDDLEVTVTPVAQQYCHIIQFPEAWAGFPRTDTTTGGRLLFGSNFGEYEFRVEGGQGSNFLVSGFTEFVGTRHYTTNRFEVDFADASMSIRPVSQTAWDDATVVPVTRRSAAPPRPLPADPSAA